MSPRSLLFSSDEGTTRSIRRAFADLEIEVTAHAEIFSALEALTSQRFDVILADQDEGPEARFLLQTARESKINSDAFFLAVGREPSGNGEEETAEGRLRKPVSVESLKYTLLTSEAFLQRMQGWVQEPAAAKDAAAKRSTIPLDSASPGVLRPDESRGGSQLVSNRVAKKRLSEPALRPPGFSEPAAENGRLVAASARRGSPRGDIKQPPAAMIREGHADKSARASGSRRGMLLFVTLILSTGWLADQMRNPQMLETLRTLGANSREQLLRQVARYLDDDGMDDDSAKTGPIPVLAKPSPSHASTTRRVQFVAWNAVPANENLPEEQDGENASADSSNVDQALGDPEIGAAPVMEAFEPSPTPAHALIPPSLTNPAAGSGKSAVSAAPAISRLFSPLQPVSLSEQAAQRLLLEKVAPFYPEQAIKLGIRGPVILEAWIARDGTIRDLKLIQGPILLGKAAYEAVKQWRYKPYAPNGEAVEAQTYVTVNFNQP